MKAILAIIAVGALLWASSAPKGMFGPQPVNADNSDVAVLSR